MTNEPEHHADRAPMDVASCSCAGIRRAARAVTQFYDAALRPTGLTSTQFTMLAVLAYRGDLAVTRLAEALVVDRTTLTRNLRLLAEKGLVRDRQGEDRRVREVGVTSAGRAAFDRAIPYWRHAQAGFVETMGEERWVGFFADLDAAVDAATSHDESNGPAMTRVRGPSRPRPGSAGKAQA